MEKKQTNCVIAGGGIIGILASIILAEKFDRVTLIEKDRVLGGLLSSIQDEQGFYFDYGTHIPSLSGIDELDHILFGDESEQNDHWIKFPSLRAQNYFNGLWNQFSVFLDARVIEKSKYNQGIVELFQLHVENNGQDPANLKEYLQNMFGETFTKEIYRGVLKKLYGAELEELEARPTSLFGLKRLIVLNEEITVELKKIEYFDRRIGFHRNIVNPSSFPNLYPKSEMGCQYWVNSLVKKAKDKGVVFKTDTFVKKINLEGKEVASIELADDTNISCQLLVWTIPLILAFKAAGIDYQSRRPNLRTTTLFHFGFDKPLLNQDAPHVSIYDSRFKIWRVTLYPNINPNKQKGIYTLTAEVLSTEEEAKTLSIDRAVEELKSIEIVERDAKVLTKTQQILANTFPVPEIGFTDNAIKVYDDLTKAITNILPLGRVTGKKWFMSDLFKETYEITKNLKIKETVLF